MESLSASLRDVQKAKCCLESRLNEKRNKRKDKENVSETVNLKNTQVNDLHTQMTETRKIAEHKVAQTQAHSDSIEGSNQNKRHILESITMKMKNSQECRAEEMQSFEVNLSKVAKLMTDAKVIYSDGRLLVEITEKKREYEDLNLKRGELDEEVTSVTCYLAKLEEQANDRLYDDIDKEGIMQMLTEEQVAVRKYLDNINEQIESARQCLQ